jgi:hypothetical protein
VGYTHYWYRPVGSEIDSFVWEAICEDTRKLIAAAPCKIVEDYERASPPLIDGDTILFNGPGDYGHENFYFPRVTEPQVAWRAQRPDVFAFCKTERKPYDRVVCAVLGVIAGHNIDGLRVLSDGKAEWELPLKWASEVLGRPITIELSEK